MFTNNALPFFLLLLLSSSRLSFIHGDPIQLPTSIIREHTPIGHLLVTLKSRSAHQPSSYRFVNHNHREIQRLFSLNATTGELRVAADLDRELICTQHRRSECRFLLKVFELFNETLYHVPILIEDINDHRPIFPYASPPLELHISENSPPFQSKLFIQPADDQDLLDQQRQLKYQLKHVEKTFPFRLETNTDLSDRLALVLTESLDREYRDVYHCTLHVTDTADHDEQLQIKIIVDDVNDHSPIFESEKYSIELSEKTPVNSTILRVHASDADIGLNGRVTYELTDASKQFSKLFSIGNETGVVRLRSRVDYEQRSSYLFYIQARDSGKEIRSSQSLINITIIDENDCFPVINFRFLPEMNYNPLQDQIELSEQYPIDKFFAQIVVTDQDSQLRGQVRLWFTLLDDYHRNETSFHLYRIDQSTYFFNRSKSFDFELQHLYRIIFFAEDSDPRHPLRTNKTLTIRIRDENDHRPRFLHSFYHLSIEENNPVNLTLTKIEAFDADNGENGRISYALVTNETTLPFHIDSRTGLLSCTKSLDREQRAHYQFEILARDHGHPVSLSSKIPIQVDINDVNDHSPRFEHDHYEFSIAENFTRAKPVGVMRAKDLDHHPRLTYRIDKEDTFSINPRGEIYLQSSVDREQRDRYRFHVIVSDTSFQRSVPVTVHILDVNDCQPQWRVPSDNRTILVINKDTMPPGTMILKLDATDQDAKDNGRVSYVMDEKIHFLDLSDSGELILNSTPTIGRYLLRIQAKDHGSPIQHSSSIEFFLLVGDNQTNGSFISHDYYPFNMLSTTKRFLLLLTFFISLAFLLVFIICLVFVLICRYRREKYFDYIKSQRTSSTDPKTRIVENQLIDLNSNSSKLSLDDLHQKRLLDHSSSPSYTGANIYTPHHQISSIMKPTPTTTSDYYSNSSKHDEDVDEWTDDQQQQQQQQRSSHDRGQNEWSIEKLLYPDWLYKESGQTKKHLNTSTFINFHSCQTIETSTCERNATNGGKRTVSSNSQASPKQVRFGCQEHVRSYPQLSTTIRHLGPGTTTVITNDEEHHTFI